MKPSILILMFTPYLREPRAMRQVEFFKKDYDVTVVSFGEVQEDGFEHIQIPHPIPRSLITKIVSGLLYRIFLTLKLFRLSSRLYPVQRWVYNRLKNRTWDYVIAHDIVTLPLANRIDSIHGVIADMHEYAPRQYDHNAQWMKSTGAYFSWVTRHEMTKVKAAITVSQGIANEYREQFGIPVSVIMNATSYHELKPSSKADDVIRLVHSGVAAAHRGLDLYVDAVLSTTSNVTLDFYLVTDGHEAYYEQLIASAKNDPRITFHNPVAYDQLIVTLNKYDVGLSLIAPSTFNHKKTLPNKFFDYIQARLGIISGPSDEIIPFIMEYKVGEITEGFTAHDLTHVLDNLSVEAVHQMKNHSHAVADMLSGEREMVKLKQILANMKDAQR